MRTLWRNARLTTLAEPAGWGLVEHGSLLCEGELLQWVGNDTALPAGLAVDAEHDLAGALVTPGLVDCHTHLVYAGQRAREFELGSRARATKTSPGPAVASARPSPPPAPPMTRPCSLSRADVRWPCTPRA